MFGKPAPYFLQLDDGRSTITEAGGNHPARMRFMAGTVEERRFGIDADGTIVHLRWLSIDFFSSFQALRSVQEC
jgi:hypothetical protein